MERRSSAVSAGGVGGMRGTRRRWRGGTIGLALVIVAAGTSRASEADLRLGEELFTRQWQPNDPRCHGGDGLGPVYNATSCVACHGQGGSGGAGPAKRNVEVISAIGGVIEDFRGPHKLSIPFGSEPGQAVGVLIPGIRPARGVVVGRGGGRARDVHLATNHFHLSTSDIVGRYRNGFVIAAGGKTLKAREFDVEPGPEGEGLVLSCAAGSLKARTFALKPDEEDLIKLHPGLLTASSAVIHRFGVDPAYAEWRAHLTISLPHSHSRSDHHLGVITGGRILTSQRNSPPLFGLGLIDALPDEILVATAAQQPAMVRGRVNRMTSGRIGKFGWKAQTTDLRGFVLAACASELGLESPGHPQAVSPLAPDSRAKAPDLTPEECDALVAYVKALPAPTQFVEADSRVIQVGRASFEEVGCADCHRPSLGSIDGIFSDLLLHDMGPSLSDASSSTYGSNSASLGTNELASGPEWRTPPLWGYRDSAPYLHDGRAANLHEVVRAHKGQAFESARRFFQLPDLQQLDIERFLKSLTAPPPVSPGDLAATKGSPRRRRSMLGPSASSSPAPRPVK